MCGRFTLTVSIEKLREAFPLYEISEAAVRFNIAPSQSVLAIRQESREAKPQGVYLRWGLIPSWAKETSIGNRQINARSETVAEKPAFRAAFTRRRCLIPADGFYEWQKLGGKGKNLRKQPFHIRLRDRSPFVFAGLYEFRRVPDEAAIESCTILTTEPNELVRPIHDRMPVILPEGLRDRWVDPTPRDPAEWLELLRPYPSQEMETVPVGAMVNDPRHDRAECLEGISLPAAEGLGEKPGPKESSPSLFD